MGKITDIQPQKKRKSRVSIYIDGEFFCGLEKLTALEHRLKIGDEVNEEKLSRAVFESEVTQAFDKAAGHLAARPHSEEELRKYLTEKGFSSAVIDRALEKMSSYGYIDDAEFVRAYIESHRAKFGVRRLG
ncbi:MAG: RecX family transcriptional regulator, partial [Clostridiales bacterium]|nr:RecX family transcriptional regulator [Clostridiales bacterium]